MWVKNYKDHYRLDLKSYYDEETQEPSLEEVLKGMTALVNKVIELARMNPRCYYLRAEPSVGQRGLYDSMGFRPPFVRSNILRFDL